MDDATSTGAISAIPDEELVRVRNWCADREAEKPWYGEFGDSPRLLTKCSFMVSLIGEVLLARADLASYLWQNGDNCLVCSGCGNIRPKVIDPYTVAQAAKILTGWLDNFVDEPVRHVPANVLACDAVRDCRDLILALANQPTPSPDGGEA